MIPPQIVELSLADLFLALIIGNVVKTVVEVSQPEHRTMYTIQTQLTSTLLLLLLLLLLLSLPSLRGR